MNQPIPPSDPAAPEAPASASAPLVEVYGFLNSAIGLGETARLLVRALRAAGCPARAMAVPLKGRERVEFTSEEVPASLPSPEAAIRILHLNPEHLPEFLPRVPEDFFTSARVVIVPYWETETIPMAARACARYFDEVWCTTSFLAESFGQGLGLPTRVFPAPLAFPGPVAPDTGGTFGFEGRHVFLFSFDYYSCFKRKNPDGVCEAFTRAFPTEEPGGPILAVKSNHGKEHPRQEIYLKARFGHRQDIVFIDGYIPENERTALFDRCDTYVSLHRSEGLGMTILEAMAQGKPCIATAYSGNLDFTLPEHSHPIPFRKSPIGPGSIHYPEDEEWAEPDLDAAARAMRECVANPDAARTLGAKALAWVRLHHQFEMVGKVLLGMIRDLLARPIDGEAKQRVLAGLAGSKPMGQASHSAAAYLSIRQARENLKELEAMIDNLAKKQKPVADACRRLMQSQKLLASAISNSLKLSKEIAARDQREAKIKEHYENLILQVMLEKMRK
jgi:hypothetical protein